MNRLSYWEELIADKVLAKQLWEDQIIWGLGAFREVNGTIERIEPFSKEWNEKYELLQATRA